MFGNTKWKKSIMWSFWSRHFSTILKPNKTPILYCYCFKLGNLFRNPRLDNNSHYVFVFHASICLAIRNGLPVCFRFRLGSLFRKSTMVNKSHYVFVLNMYSFSIRQFCSTMLRWQENSLMYSLSIRQSVRQY